MPICVFPYSYITWYLFAKLPKHVAVGLTSKYKLCLTNTFTGLLRTVLLSRPNVRIEKIYYTLFWVRKPEKTASRCRARTVCFAAIFTSGLLQDSHVLLASWVLRNANNLFQGSLSASHESSEQRHALQWVTSLMPWTPPHFQGSFVISLQLYAFVCLGQRFWTLFSRWKLSSQHHDLRVTF